MSSFLDHLAERLGTAPDKAERALGQFAEHLHERVAQEKDVRIPGLGRFYRRDGALAFEPDEALALAANQRFAGLANLTVDVLQPAAPPTEKAPPQPAPSAAVPFSGDSGPADAPEPDLLDEQGEDEQANEPEETERHWEASDGAGHLLGATSEPLIEDADYSLVDAEGVTSDLQPLPQPAPEPSGAQESKAPKAAEPKSSSIKAGAKTSDRALEKPKRPLEKEKSAPGADVRRWLPWAAAAAMIALLALLGVLLLSGDRDTPSDTPPLAAQENPSETASPAPASEEVLEEDPPVQDTPATTPDEPEALAPEPEPEPEEDPFPLRSSGTIDPEAGGYTLVVGSVPQLVQAETLLNEYRDLGYRVGLLETERDGQVNYRVGVGQFFDRSEAEAVYNNLPSDLPEGAWLLRIGSGI